MKLKRNLKLKRWLNEVGKSLKLFWAHKDIEHLKDVGRLTKYYLKK